MHKRNINIEILRIMSIYLIILGHCIGHSHLNVYHNGVNALIINAIKIITIPATNVFVLISSYFLIDSHFKIKRICSLWLQVLFFSMGGVLFSLLLNLTIAPKEIIRVLLPISGDQYWFARTYLGLYLFSPFLSLTAKKMSKLQFQILLIFLLAAFSLWPSLIPFAMTWNIEMGNGLLWFIVLFFIGAYIKLHVKNNLTPSRYFLLSTALTLLTILGYYAIYFISLKVGLRGKGTWIVTNFTSINMTGIAVFLFLAFVAMKNNCKETFATFVLLLSSSTFSVYLIHENMYVRRWLWKNLNLIQYSEKRWLPILCIVISIIIFLLSVIIDKLSWNPLNKYLISKISFSRLQNRIDSSFDVNHE